MHKEDKMNIFIVGTWGDFNTYKKALYKYGEDKDRESWEGNVQCKSSTLALINMYSNRGHNVDALILLPATLIVNSHIAGDKYIDELVSRNEVMLSEIEDKLVNKAREKINEWINSSDCGIEKAALNNVAFTIAPTIGTFSSKDYIFRFNGSLNLYQLMTYYHVYNALISGSHEYGMIVLDATHGVNYTTILAHEATRLAAYVYAIKSSKRIKYRIFNSDPYPSGSRCASSRTSNNETTELRIHEVYSENIGRIEGIAKVSSSALETLEHYINLVKNNEEIIKDALVLGDSLRNSLHLVVISLRRDIQSYLKQVENDLESLKSLSIKINRNNNELIISYSYSPRLGNRGIAYKALTSIHAVLEVANMVISNVKENYDKINGSYLAVINLKDLDTLNKNKYYSGPTQRAIIDSQIKNIKRKLTRYVNDLSESKIPQAHKLFDELFKWHLLSLYLDKNKEELWSKCIDGSDPLSCANLSKAFENDRGCKESPEGLSERDYRNFIAHGGLSMRSTYVRIDRDSKEIYLSYGECISNVIKLIYSNIIDNNEEETRIKGIKDIKYRFYK